MWAQADPTTTVTTVARTATTTLERMEIDLVGGGGFDWGQLWITVVGGLMTLAAAIIAVLLTNRAHIRGEADRFFLAERKVAFIHLLDAINALCYAYQDDGARLQADVDGVTIKVKGAKAPASSPKAAAEPRKRVDIVAAIDGLVSRQEEALIVASPKFVKAYRQASDEILGQGSGQNDFGKIYLKFANDYRNFAEKVRQLIRDELGLQPLPPLPEPGAPEADRR